MTKRYAYYRSDGVIELEQAVMDGMQAPTISGLTAIEVPTGLDLDGKVVVDGQVVDEEWQGAQGEARRQAALGLAKRQHWERIKETRTVVINGPLTTPYGVFQCREQDRQNITDAIQLAQTLTAAGEPVAITWTLADNSTVVLDLQQLVTVGLLLGQRVQTAHATARSLRSAVDAATTVAEVNAVAWPQ